MANVCRSPGGPRRQRRQRHEWPTMADSGPPPARWTSSTRFAQMTLAPNTPDDRLDSWKEIAAYLRRGVRTVRRWEREEGLPVHRHVHRVLGSVYAFKSEIDRWQ